MTVERAVNVAHVDVSLRMQRELARLQVLPLQSPRFVVRHGPRGFKFSPAQTFVDPSVGDGTHSSTEGWVRWGGGDEATLFPEPGLAAPDSGRFHAGGNFQLETVLGMAWTPLDFWLISQGRAGC